MIHTRKEGDPFNKTGLYLQADRSGLALHVVPSLGKRFGLRFSSLRKRFFLLSN